MLDLLLIPIALVYLLVVALLFAFGINFFYLSLVAWRSRAQPLEAPAVAAWPPVTVQLPIYNELYVARRLIEAAAQLDYPNDCLEIQVLDDSDDETAAISQQVVARLAAQGRHIHHLRRRDRTGYKAGALAAGLAQARGEFLAVFDADFVPPPDFLKRTIPHFQDPAVGFVQARWGHLNQGYSLLTFLQSLAIDAHFMIEQFARSRAGFWFNFNGTAGIWRRQAMEAAGGWSNDTLTEDLDLSYRVFFAGWRAVYLRDLEVPAELPASFSAYRRQQHRWARGSLECARKFIPQIWHAPLPTSMKVEATLHLTGYAVHLLMFVLVFLYPFILILSQRYANLISLFGIGTVFNLTAFAPTTFFILAQHQLDRSWQRRLPAILFITALGAGMIANTARAAVQAFGGRPGVFERTPKFGLLEKRQPWTRRRYQARLDPIVLFELFLIGVNAWTIFLAFHSHNWIIAFYAGIFCLGLGFTAGLSLLQAWAVRRQGARSGANPADE